MSPPLRIAVADDEADMREYYRRILPRLGYEVAATAASGTELIELSRTIRPDVIITDIRMPETDGIEAASVICRERPVPVILVSGFHDTELIERAESDHVMAYLIKPVKQADLVPAISLAVRRFEHWQALRREADGLKQSLDGQKILERAATALGRRLGIDELAAAKRIEELARQRGCPTADIAWTVLSAEDPGGT